MTVSKRILENCPKRFSTGLRDATKEDIARMTKEYEELGYEVEHVTESLPHNGILRCVLKSAKPS